jgi:hypothetical protein
VSGVTDKFSGGSFFSSAGITYLLIVILSRSLEKDSRVPVCSVDDKRPTGKKIGDDRYDDGPQQIDMVNKLDKLD